MWPLCVIVSDFQWSTNTLQSNNRHPKRCPVCVFWLTKNGLAGTIKVMWCKTHRRACLTTFSALFLLSASSRQWLGNSLSLPLARSQCPSTEAIQAVSQSVDVLYPNNHHHCRLVSFALSATGFWEEPGSLCNRLSWLQFQQFQRSSAKRNHPNHPQWILASHCAASSSNCWSFSSRWFKLSSSCCNKAHSSPVYCCLFSQWVYVTVIITMWRPFCW